MFREEHSYYVKELRHYKDLSLDDYRQMVSLRIDGLVVKNQRCINPVSYTHLTLPTILRV